ncbi:hypothetical protein [Flagellimonas flava]|uniref:hypothetical protein n=1 Tax=Flagellimonas flava TaxID=570519 RepID=UPI003D64BEC1
MPDKIIAMFFTIVDAIATVFTIIALIGFTELVSGIAGILAIIFWIPRIKREVDTYHGGSFIKYFKSVITKKKK